MNAADLAGYLSTPLAIGKKTINGRMVLAPMAGLGHVAFRELVAELGGFGLLFTGMCSAKAVPRENPAVSMVFRWRNRELPHTVCQIFGADPDVMARAARRIEQEGFFGVDLNFGCSVAAICKKGCGAALLKTPVKAAHIVTSVRKAIQIPVFVKFRTGWSDDPLFAADTAKRFEDAGADALTFHPPGGPGPPKPATEMGYHHTGTKRRGHPGVRQRQSLHPGRRHPHANPNQMSGPFTGPDGSGQTVDLCPMDP